MKQSRAPHTTRVGNSAPTFLLRFEEEGAFEHRAGAGTKTLTESREERDQDIHLAAGTLTTTRAREERDQDMAAESWYAIPVLGIAHQLE
jgi:hypothetical protein